MSENKAKNISKIKNKPDLGSFFARKKKVKGDIFQDGSAPDENDNKAVDVKNVETNLKNHKAEEGGFMKDFFRNKLIRWMLVMGIVANVADWGLLFFLLRPVDPDIILHYNVYFGVDMSGHYRLAFIMPIIGLIIYIFNLLMALFFWAKKERIGSHILLLSAFMCQLCLIVASVSIIIINY